MNMKKNKFLLSIALIMLFMIAAIPGMKASALSRSVSNFAELKTALANGESVILTDDITVTQTLEIPASYSGEIKSDGKKLNLGTNVENMFVVSDGSNVTFDSIIFDGQENGRIIDAGKATVTIKNSTIKNATTETFQQKFVDEKDTQRYEGGAIYAAHTTLELNNTIFENNHTKAIVPSPGAPHGGAIVSYSANMKIMGGLFKNNYTGRVDKEFSSHGEGGAIKLHPGSTLTINDPKTTKKDTTVFDGNHLDDLDDKGGRQGGAIEVTQSNIYVYGSTFNITGPFNTGGAIKFEGCSEAVVNNSHFETVENKGIIGVAGGAITSENSNLSIDSSSFKTNGGSRVSEAGGLIQVVAGGKFNLTNSSLEGAGAWWNAGRYTANTGGAICFYDDSSVTAKIENTTIKNFMADGAGAGISLAKSAGHKASVTLTMTDTSIENTACYVWQGNGHGGAMFVGDGNKVTIEGGKISSQTASNNAGGIFNEGSVTITGSDKGPAHVTGNFAYNMVGGIYNDGYLKIDKANFSGNKKGDWSTGDGHVIDKTEMGGINIYADQDVIITPNATFDDKDIRVLDGQSKILLTGKLTNQINVSISEKPKKHNDSKSIFDRYSETQERYIGYTVAAGTDNYTPTPEDAQNLHYVTKDKDQKTTVSEFKDHTGVGKWDYVLDPITHNIVLGQRAKMIFHANGTTAKPASFADNTTEKEILYTIYSSESPWTSPVQMQNLSEEPTRDKFDFTGWYYVVEATNEQAASDTNDDHGIQQITNPAAVAEHLLNFAIVKFTGTSEAAGMNSISNLAMMRSASTQASGENGKGITSIVSPYIINTYAGWAQTIDIPVQKTWIDTEKADQKAVTIRLLANGTEVTSLVLDEQVDWKGEFKKLPVYQKNNDGKYTSITYTIKEDSLGTDYKDPEINPKSIDGTAQLEAQEKGETGSEFIVKNQKLYRFDLTVTKIWKDEENIEGLRPQSVSITLTPSSGDPITASISKDNTYTFEKLPKKDAQNKEITYTLSEKPVDKYKTEIGPLVFDLNDSSKATASITNSREVEYIELSGGKIWDDADNQDDKRPKSITVNVKRGGDIVATKDLNGESNTWSYQFDKSYKLQKYVGGEEAVYTVEEANAPTDYTVKITGTTITNSYKPQVLDLEITKIWDDKDNQDGKRPDSITVKLLKNGQETDQTITINAKDKWQGKFVDLPVFEAGKKVKYTIQEVAIDVEGYISKIENYQITNSYKPESIEISGQKIWNDANNQDGKRPASIQVSLMRGDTILQTVQADADGNWEYSFEPVDKYEAGQLINYSVKEESVDGYAASYSDTGYNITNTHNPEKTSITVTKDWEDRDNYDQIRPAEIQFALLADGKEQGTYMIKASEQWTYKIEDLPVYQVGQVGKKINYTVKEISEITDYDDPLVTGSAIDGFTITNTHKLYSRYEAMHVFISITDGYNLPQAILERTPMKKTNLLNDVKVDADDNFDHSDYIDQINGGVWSWVEWEKPTQIVEQSNLEFLGKWKFVKDTPPTETAQPTRTTDNTEGRLPQTTDAITQSTKNKIPLTGETVNAVPVLMLIGLSIVLLQLRKRKTNNK